MSESKPRVAATLPLKYPGQGKARLAGLLDAERRAELRECLFFDALEALASCALIGPIAVVSAAAPPLPPALARRVEWLDDAGGGLNAGAEIAARHFARVGEEHLLILHADLPCIDGAELDAALRSHLALEPPAVTLSADRHGLGSNLLLCSPPALMSFHYGADSCRLHLQAARAAGARTQRLEQSKLGFDLDTPEDFEKLLAIEGLAPRSAAWLAAYRQRMEAGA